MLFVGLILVLAALVTIGYMWFGTAGLDPVEVDLGVFTATLSPLWIFLLGAASVLVLAIGFAMFLAGLRRRQRQRRELKDLRRKTEQLERDRGGARRPAPREERVDEGEPVDDRRPGVDRPGSPSAGVATTGAGADDRVVRDDAGEARAQPSPERREDRIDLPGDHRTPPDRR